MALLQRAAVNDSRNLPASRDCFGVSQRRRVSCALYRRRCLFAHQWSKALRLDNAITRSFIALLIASCPYRVFRLGAAWSFRYAPAPRLPGHMRASTQVYTGFSYWSRGLGFSATRRGESSLIFAGSALPIIYRPVLKLVLPVADCSKHADTIG